MFGWPSFCLACFLSCSTAAHRVYGCFPWWKQVLAILYCWIAFIKKSKCWPYCTIELFSWRKARFGHTVPLNYFHQGKQVLAILCRWIAFIEESKCWPYCATWLLPLGKASTIMLPNCFLWGKQALTLLCYSYLLPPRKATSDLWYLGMQNGYFAVQGNKPCLHKEDTG